MTLSYTWLVPLVLLGVSPMVRADDSISSSLRAEVKKYLARYEERFREEHHALEEARWLRAQLPAEDREASQALVQAEVAWATFAGSIENIELSRTYLRRASQLVVRDQRQLARIAFDAAGTPGIVPDLVPKSIATVEEASSIFRSRLLTIDGQLVSRAEIDRILRDERDLALRRRAWESRQEIGRAEKPLLVRLRWLQNEIVRSMGARNALAYRAREYGLDVADLQRRLDGVLRELRPLQTELHTYLRFELARRFELPVPDAIPAHWLPDETGAAALVAWLGLGEPLAAVDAELANDTPRALVERADRLWTSLGFIPLPEFFYANSVFGPNPASETLRVSHLDLGGDVRAIFDTSSDARGWLEANRLVGQAHCAFLSNQSDVPLVLRHGPNRAFHAALAEAVALGATNPRTLRSAGLSGPTEAEAEIPRLFITALQTVIPIVHAGDTLFQFEREIYADDIDPDTWNAHWWAALQKYEGIAPPAPRDERWFDAAAEKRLLTSPAQAYDEAFALVIGFELHDHIARSILDADAAAVDITAKKVIGDFVKSIARFGATVDWRTKMREKLGYEISARAIVEYFEPLRAWLAEQNKGRRATLQQIK